VVEVRDRRVRVLLELVQDGPQGVVRDVEAQGLLLPLERLAPVVLDVWEHGFGGAISASSNIENWSSQAPLRPLVERSTAFACTATMAEREGPTLSKAPHFMSDSRVRLL
jgi:hypothetical protein